LFGGVASASPMAVDGRPLDPAGAAARGRCELKADVCGPGDAIPCVTVDGRPEVPAPMSRGASLADRCTQFGVFGSRVPRIPPNLLPHV